jgi:hypothetical protein
MYTTKIMFGNAVEIVSLKYLKKILFLKKYYFFMFSDRSVLLDKKTM